MASYSWYIYIDTFVYISVSFTLFAFFRFNWLTESRPKVSLSLCLSPGTMLRTKALNCQGLRRYVYVMALLVICISLSDMRTKREECGCQELELFVLLLCAQSQSPLPKVVGLCGSLRQLAQSAISRQNITNLASLNGAWSNGTTHIYHKWYTISAWPETGLL